MREDASPDQLKYVSSIHRHTGLKPPKAILRSFSATRDWIALALHVCSEDEIKKLAKTRPKKSAAEIASFVQRLASIAGIQEPSGRAIGELRVWLTGLLAAFSIPPSDKLLHYWSQALRYRDLNAIAEAHEQEIAKPVVEKLAEELPRLPDSFEAPRTINEGEPIALLIAFISSSRRVKPTVLLGVPLSYDAGTRSLIPPPQAAAPFFNREWLEPPDPDAVKNAYLGSVPDCDEFFIQNPPPDNAAWPEYWAYVGKFVGTVTGNENPLPNLAPLIHQRDTHWKIVKWDGGKAVERIAKAYQRALISTPPLLNAVCSKPVQPTAMDPTQALQAAGSLLGHIDTYDRAAARRKGFSLEQSQRVAATAMTQVEPGQLLAVNGPPGTGKTSFLRAVIGTEYVRAALRGEGPSLILATAATNKAVTNIIESFAEIASPEMEPDWSSRWIPHLPSYGWFYPARSKSDSELAGYMVLKRHREKGQPDQLLMAIAAEEFASLQQQQRAWMVDAYLDLHRQVLGLPKKAPSAAEAARAVRESLTASIERMHRAQALFAQCVDYPPRAAGCKRPESEWQQLLDECNRARQQLATDLKRQTDLLHSWNGILQSLREADRLRRKRRGLLYWVRKTLFGDTYEDQALALDNSAIAQMNEIDAGITLYGTTALAIAELQHARVIKAVLGLEAQQRGVADRTESARAMLGNWFEWRSMTRCLLEELAEEAPALQTEMAVWAADGFPTGGEPHRRFEELLDRRFRFRHFHMAARYWEARWLADAPIPMETCEMHLALKCAAMLAPVVVATVYTLPAILEDFEFADLLIFDESGQASPELGAASFAFAKRAIVIGDTYQLKPVWNVGKEADARLRRDLAIPDLEEAFNVSSGSIMRVAQYHTHLADREPGPLGPGIGLVAHYRCRATIIEYCRRLIYGDGLVPVRDEVPPNGQRNFLYPPMAWVAVTAKKFACKQGGSWVNEDQIQEIVRWLKHDGPRILAHYGAARLSDVVALIAPFRAQAAALERAATNLLGEDQARTMVIDTVHALQGAEKPIVAFSLTQDEGQFFVDRDGPNLLNVAVSRAKDCFILFATSSILQPAMNARGAGKPRKHSRKEPLDVLLTYLSEAGKRLYPREVVVIEAPGKVACIGEALGLSAEVVATGGHFRRLVLEGGLIHAELTEDGDRTVARLEKAAADLRQIDAFYLATDDDEDGEEIAWHVQEVLRTLGVTDPSRVLRMRFYALTPDEIRKARELALPGIDERRVRANVLRSLFDGELHRQLGASGVQASRPQLALLREIADRKREQGSWRVRLDGWAGGNEVSGYVLDEATAAPTLFSDSEVAALVAAQVPVGSAANQPPHITKTVLLPRYPVATTAQTLIAGFTRLGWSPKRTSDALNDLYLGHAAPRAFGADTDEDHAMTAGETS